MDALTIAAACVSLALCWLVIYAFWWLIRYYITEAFDRINEFLDKL